MSRRSLRCLRLSLGRQLEPSVNPITIRPCSCRRISSAEVLPSSLLNLSTTARKLNPLNRARRLMRETKYTDLMDCLTASIQNPAHVWGYYSDLYSYLDGDPLPLEVHQAVLRKSVPPANVVRSSHATQVQTERGEPHAYEWRMQTVVRNMRMDGYTPSLDDYHFILSQFAAVGHYMGVMQVYKELIHWGLRPQSKTFGLCLQAIAYRQSLSYSPAARPYILETTLKLCREFLEEMAARKISFTSVNLDLALRILKETMDERAFLTILKFGYGIDMNNPDRPPLEIFVDSAVGNGVPEAPLSSPVPFSTSALNTVIDMLGRFGDVSKLVQAFEVLTVPLPSQADQHFSSSFDDDDDFWESSPSSPPPLHKAPYADPNTTTYNTMIRHLARLGHAALVRHYVLRATLLDIESDWLLHRDTWVKPKKDIAVPGISVNRGTLLPAFGLANRYKNMELMRWVQKIILQVLKRKEARINHYDMQRVRFPHLHEIKDEIKAAASSAKSVISESGSVVSSLSSSSSQRDTPPELPSSSTTACMVSSPGDAPDPSTVASSSQVSPEPNPPLPALEADLAAELSTLQPKRVWNIDLHLAILRRDVAEIGELRRRVEDVLGRTAQRIKERLGRRAWAGKDVYLASDGDRVRISKEKWVEIVNFRPAPRWSILARSASPTRKKFRRKKRRHELRRGRTSRQSAGKTWSLR